MLGVLRFFLASCVIMFHLTGAVPNIGQLSVNFFYVISGYLITLILNDTYKCNSRAFAINRFLRLYPTYYFFAIISIFLSITPIFGVTTSSFHPSWVANQTAMDWLGNLFIFPWAFLSDYAVVSIPNLLVSESFRFRLIPSTWSIAVEIVCYFSLWLFTSRNLYFAIISLVVAIFMHVGIQLSNLAPEFTYAPFYAALLPFSMGAIGYFISISVKINYKAKISSAMYHTMTLVIVITAFLINWYISTKSLNFYSSTSYYLNNFIALFSVMAMHNSKLNGQTKMADKIMGDLSYPLFLCQYIAGYIGWLVIGKPESIRGWDIFFSGYIFAIIMSAISIKLIDKNTTKIRNRIRPKLVTKTQLK
ncbi:acyltransferase family protein [Serratia liquefaciens]|uniref:acyltransferase family protein n=1 Tax=Serratia liquefaciens TaxID=614 RepID=UPI0022B986C7|nr:acyltransferase [Serratia liquefaciens]